MKTNSILAITFIYLAFLALTVAMMYPVVSKNAEQVSEELARKNDAYTEMGGRFYVTRAR